MGRWDEWKHGEEATRGVSRYGNKRVEGKSKMKKKKVLNSGYAYWVQKEMETKWTKVYDMQSIDGTVVVSLLNEVCRLSLDS